MKIQGHIIIRRKPKNGDNGQDAVLYELMPSGQIINFSNDNVFSPSFVTCSIKKIQGSNLIMLTTASALSTEGLRLSYAMDDGSDGDTVINPTTKIYPNDKISYINFILKKNEVIIDKKTIQICNDGKDGEKGEDGLQGCILRQSEWVSGVEYRNDEALISGTRYLDIAIVTTGANTFNAYKCLKTHVSSTSIPVTNTTYWQKFNTLQPVYTPLIMAQNAILRFMQGNQLLIMKPDGKTIVAGFVGGDIPFWVGGETPNNASVYFGMAGNGQLAHGNISWNEAGDLTCERGIFKVGIKKIYRKVSLDKYTSESFKADLTTGLNFVFTKNTGNDTHYMTLPTSTDLDGFDSEMIFYGNPGAVMISGENGTYPFMYNGMRVKQIKIGSFPRRLHLSARISNDIGGSNRIEWWIVNTSDFTLQGKISSSGYYNYVESQYYNSL